LVGRKAAAHSHAHALIAKCFTLLNHRSRGEARVFARSLVRSFARSVRWFAPSPSLRLTLPIVAIIAIIAIIAIVAILGLVLASSVRSHRIGRVFLRVKFLRKRGNVK
jgi:ABC-type sugar transport system permease subunit